MAKGVFVTGTGTDVGKTYIVALIIKKLRQNHINCGYYKAALSGAERKGEQLIAGDAAYVYEIAKLKGNPNDSVSYVFESAVSPHLAANLTNTEVTMKKIKNDFNNIQRKYSFVIVEGSGGIVCPISMGRERIMLIDIIKELNLSTVLVADAGLGTINSSILTLEYMKQHNIEVNMIILNNYDDKNVIHTENKKFLTNVSDLPIYTCGTLDEKIDITEQELVSFFKYL